MTPFADPVKEHGSVEIAARCPVCRPQLSAPVTVNGTVQRAKRILDDLDRTFYLPPRRRY